MSNWKHFFVDYPERAYKILTKFTPEAIEDDLEITLMLTVAATILTIPHERLLKKHPSGDAARFTEAEKQLKLLKDENFTDSELFKLCDPKNWRYIEEMENIVGMPDEWHPNIFHPESPFIDKSNDSIIRHLRNAFSHGNIFSCGNPIEDLVFLSRIDDTKISLSGNVKYGLRKSALSPAILEISGNKVDVNNEIEPTNITGDLSYRRNESGVAVTRARFDINADFPDKYSLLMVSTNDFLQFLKNWSEFLEKLDTE